MNKPVLCWSCQIPVSIGTACDDCEPDPLANIFDPIFTIKKADALESNHTPEPRLVEPDKIKFEDLDMDIGAYQEYIIGPFIQPGDLVYFVGREGTGKSTLLCELLSCLVDPKVDEALLGTWKINREQFDPTKDLVLVVDGENSRPKWAQMINRVLVGRGIELDSDRATHIKQAIKYTHADDFQLAQSEPDALQRAADRLADFVIKKKIKVVVMDPIWDVFQPQGNADSNWITHGLRRYQGRVCELGITTLVIAHPADEIRGQSLAKRLAPFGSSKQRGFLDVWFGIQTPKIKASEDSDGNKIPNSDKGNHVEIYYMKGRRAWWVKKEAKIRVRFKADSGGGYSEVTPKEAWPQRPTPTASKFGLETLRIMDAVDFTFNFEWCKDRDINYPKMLKVYKEELIPDGLVSRVGRGEKGSPWVYTITADGLWLLESKLKMKK